MKECGQPNKLYSFAHSHNYDSKATPGGAPSLSCAFFSMQTHSLHCKTTNHKALGSPAAGLQIFMSRHSNSTEEHFLRKEVRASHPWYPFTSEIKARKTSVRQPLSYVELVPSRTVGVPTFLLQALTCAMVRRILREYTYVPCNPTAPSTFLHT